MPTAFEEADALSSQAIDDHMGETLRLLPWISSDYASGPDPDRATVDFRGIFGGAAGSQKILSGRGSESSVNGSWTTVDRTLSADAANWPAAAREGDRIQRLDRPGMPVFEIDAITPDGINRISAQLTATSMEPTP